MKKYKELNRGYLFVWVQYIVKSECSSYKDKDENIKSSVHEWKIILSYMLETCKANRHVLFIYVFNDFCTLYRFLTLNLTC